MCRRYPNDSLRLIEELQPQIRPKLERTLDQPTLQRSRGELPVRGSLAEAETRDGQRRDRDHLLLREEREPAVLEQHLGGLVELDILGA